MNTYYYQLINNLEQSLKSKESQIKNLHRLSEQSVALCKDALEELRNRVSKNPFKDHKEEIEFYKVIKPKVLSYLIFYVKRLHIESKRSKVGNKEQIKYLKKFIAKFQSYFHNNLEEFIQNFVFLKNNFKIYRLK